MALTIVKVVSTCCLSAVSLALAQAPDTYRKFSLDINNGLLRPRGEMRRWRFTDATGTRPLFQQTYVGGTHFGYRPIPYLQVDLGTEFAGSVAGKRRSTSRYETKTFTDFIFFVPVGVRGVLPLFEERLLISGGGGGTFVANVQYGDPGTAADLCDPCSSRNGWGPHAVAQALYVLGESRRVGLGVTSRWTQVKLSPGFLPNYGRRGIKDQWVFVEGTISIRF